MKTLTCMVILVFLLDHSGAGQSRVTPEEQYQKALGFLLASSHSQTDRDEALNLLRAAADKNYAPAQTALGTLYAKDSFTPRDISKAIDWFTKAAEQDDWIAQLALGRIYLLGDGVPQDSSRAKIWLLRAASHGDSAAAFYLGLLYDGRLGMPTDHEEAAKWYRQSAEAGNPYALEKLANLILKGQLGKRDPQEAYTLLLVAVEFGNQGAMLHLDSMEGDLGTNGAEAARKEAVNMRQEIQANRSKNPCNGWPGQFELRPVPPPISFLGVCEGK
ncbi:MAG: sel1 repeat family protein [Acidobacteriia bacterium]|nr:sel1 repeat family protein [Terriglobia bacterium]